MHVQHQSTLFVVFATLIVGIENPIGICFMAYGIDKNAGNSQTILARRNPKKLLWKSGEKKLRNPDNGLKTSGFVCYNEVSRFAQSF